MQVTLELSSFPTDEEVLREFRRKTPERLSKVQDVLETLRKGPLSSGESRRRDTLVGERTKKLGIVIESYYITHLEACGYLYVVKGHCLLTDLGREIPLEKVWSLRNTPRQNDIRLRRHCDDSMDDLRRISEEDGDKSQNRQTAISKIIPKVRDIDKIIREELLLD